MLCLVFAFWYIKLRDDMDVDALVTELKPLKDRSSSFSPDNFETVRNVSKALTPDLMQGFPTWGACTPGGTSACLKGYIYG